MKPMYVSIMTNRSDTLYIGVTNGLERRVIEHRRGSGSGFTSRYRIEHLVYVEEFASPRDAIAREKRLKGWRREKKLALIEKSTPDWNDLAATRST
jgi:putative endonuclease